ncbi:P-loop containing nucleoside triphosphate hydrolase protein [Daldinia vernicosa]|uniref:P-loop containing nucleoside triphosphate hydrolase protein n=1 Tax=Daldinia vernicosa TaxID=114800 RepID=UPI002007DFB5|nr:P-loop containing nucleoside triphosphate hydrolase protein [Daldinia vernicosa]KAI0844186.1 P-loop containing nucleoside triphosphate hydrolase protein [Daldinia vernicosa]
MDHSNLEYRLAKHEERIKNLEKIVLISAEANVQIWKHIPNEFEKSRDVIIELLEGSQNITNPSQFNKGLEYYRDSPQSSTEASRGAQSFTETSHGIQSSNVTIPSIESSNKARYEAEIEEMKAKMLEMTEEMKAELLKKTEDCDRIRTLLEDERNKNRAIVTTLRDIQGNIRVLCRIRPPGKDTPAADLVDFGPRDPGEFSSHWGKMTIATKRMNVMGVLVDDNPKIYDFERIFGPSDTNGDVFEHISDLVVSSTEGQRIIMFAYGQTGAGKTFTLSHKGSDAKQNGVIPRSMDLLFDTKKKLEDEFEISISVSIQEIYLDKTYDLLAAIETKRRGEEVRRNQVGKQQLHSHEEALSVIDAAMHYRVTSRTDMNATSSRSHLILSFEISRKSLANPREVRSGVLNIVDLAGSERPNEMGTTDTIRREGIMINKSLMSLTGLISCIAARKPVVYDTELVRALRPALTPQSKVVMFVMISPLKKDQEVSFQTLEKGREASAAKMASADLSGNPSTSSGPSTRGRGGSTASTRGNSPLRGSLTTRGTSPSRVSRGGQGRGRN